jgi:hypothetical protein
LFLLRTLLDLRRNTSLNVFPQGTSLPHEGTKQKELRGVNSKALKAQEFGEQEVSFERSGIFFLEIARIALTDRSPRNLW